MDIHAAIETFVAQAQAIVDSLGPQGDRKVLSVVLAGRYARVEKAFENGSCRSAFCYVDLNTGDVLRATSLKGPTKHVRGNVFDPNPVSGVGPHGANYA